MPAILLVEDNEGLSDILTFQLERSGFEVYLAKTLKSAHCYLEFADAIVLDWSLPDGEGIRLMAGLEQTYSPPVIMLTARATAEDKEMAFAAGVRYFLSKPFSYNVLQDCLNEVLESRPIHNVSNDKSEPNRLKLRSGKKII